MELFILKADNSDEINNISEELFLLIGLFFIYWALIVNVVYFSYSYLWASPHVLITSEIKSNEGEDLEFNTMDEVLEKSNKLF